MNNYDPRKTHIESRNARTIYYDNKELITDSYALGDIIEQYILFLIYWKQQSGKHSHTHILFNIKGFKGFKWSP